MSFSPRISLQTGPMILRSYQFHPGGSSNRVIGPSVHRLISSRPVFFGANEPMNRWADERIVAQNGVFTARVPGASGCARAAGLPEREPPGRRRSEMRLADREA